MINKRAKGNRLEFDTQQFFRNAVFNNHKFSLQRVGMSGQLQGLKGDFRLHQLEYDHHTEIWLVAESFLGEAKSGQAVPQKLYKWLEKDEMDFLVIRRDRKPRLWVLTDKVLKTLLI